MGIVIAMAVLAVLVVMALVRASARRDPLGHCPVCTSDAVSSIERDDGGALVLRCGACGTWRRIAASGDATRLLELRIERQREIIKACAERMERERIAAA